MIATTFIENNAKFGLSPTPKPYNLNAEQQQILNSQIKLDKNLYVPAEEIYVRLKNKHKPQD